MAPYHLNAFYSSSAGNTHSSLQCKSVSFSLCCAGEKHLRLLDASLKEFSGFCKRLTFTGSIYSTKIYKFGE